MWPAWCGGNADDDIGKSYGGGQHLQQAGCGGGERLSPGLALTREN